MDPRNPEGEMNSKAELVFSIIEGTDQGVRQLNVHCDAQA